MNTRVRTALRTMKAPSSKFEKKTEEIERSIEGEKTQNRRCSNRERKMALQQDVDMLRKKLKHEENVHRALERAFTRPLGALPRLPPYLPPYTLELLAEVAVLEEEVVRLEEQVVNFRQSLYQEAVYISSSSSKKQMDSKIDFCDHPLRTLKRSSSSEIVASDPSFLQSVMEEEEEDWISRRQSSLDATVSNQVGKQPWTRGGLAGTGSLKKLHVLDDGYNGKENQKRSFAKSTRRNNKQLPAENHVSRTRNQTKQSSSPVAMVEKQSNLSKLQLEYSAAHENAEQNSPVDSFNMVEGESSGPNKISEEILQCLICIFFKASGPDMETMSSITTENSGFSSSGTNSGSSTLSCKMPPKDCSKDVPFRDPYGICSEFGERDIGPYKVLTEIGASTVDLNRVTNSVSLIRRLKFLLGKLGSVNLQGLTHQHKLAFWINTYNSCMMHAYLEYGIPDSPQMVVALMQKAVINVGGRLLSALTIEHFILRLPYHSPSKHTDSRGVKNDEATMRNVFGLDWPEPLVTFALSCGSWSSPSAAESSCGVDPARSHAGIPRRQTIMVRVYTACNVEKELDVAKRDYLQAAIGLSTDINQFGIPKLLDWYLLDFAKDVESLLDWICLQLPDAAREEAVKCVERGRKDAFSQRIQIMPYEFGFRYLLNPS